MRRAITALTLVVAFAARASGASADDVIVETDASASRPWPRDGAPAAGIDELCRDAARAPWAVQGAPGLSVRCWVEPTSDARLALVLVGAPFTMRAFLALREDERLRVLAEVDSENDAPGGDVLTTIELVRLHRTTARGLDVIAIETRTRFTDWDADGAIEVESRRLTVCVHEPGALDLLRCPVAVPLEVVARTLERRSEDDWTGRVMATARSEAVAVLRRDGTVRVRRREGTWSALYEGERPEQFPPPERERTIVLSLLPE
jgi:hypothetical protein